MTKVILSKEKCESCSGGAPLASREQIASLRPQIPEWNIIESDGIEQLRRSFPFRNFKQALAFTDKVGEMAEAEGHHPLLLTEWGRVEVRWWSHIIGGLHVNDFIAAAKTDALYGQG